MSSPRVEEATVRSSVPSESTCRRIDVEVLGQYRVAAKVAEAKSASSSVKVQVVPSSNTMESKAGQSSTLDSKVRSLPRPRRPARP